MCSRTEAGRRGFTLVEGLVTLVIITVLIVGLLTLMDSSNRLAKQETQVSDAQGGGRSAIYEVTRLIRQARVGHLSPLSSLMPYVNEDGTVVNNAGKDEKIATSHVIREGTDAIQIRGVLFGESYFFDPPDVTCGPSPCTGEDTATVTIRQQISTGYQNFPTGRAPAVFSQTPPFFFVVTDQSPQLVQSKDGSRYAIPLYYVGVVTEDVEAIGGAYQLKVDFKDDAARKVNASDTTTGAFQRVFSGGVVDDLVLFIDQGPEDPALPGTADYTHPFLAQAVRLPDGKGGETWDVQRLVDDVEDMQIAYGIDGGTKGAIVPDRGVEPPPTGFLAGADDDEWVFNVEGEEGSLLPESDAPTRFEAFLTGPPPAGADPVYWAPTDPNLPNPVTPALRAIFVSIVTKSLDPDIKFAGPGRLGVKTLDAKAANPVSATQPYRRRVQSMAVNLRNFQ